MMNQLCKVCGEPAAGYHFGAFTCEGCKIWNLTHPEKGKTSFWEENRVEECHGTERLITYIEGMHLHMISHFKKDKLWNVRNTVKKNG
ncbi:hypothetical protein JTE90_004831 [Oedothorax gibbosus]|uniref:Nuclear receptor domain-containing protein n=1 Tax=Oedothorax gibbosus TaxID=931172 RepID=A0AAV6UPX8_9ARAC|nr:hypothetical protein JTE90_004831 [Oedothorax gibbosus]